MPRVPFLLSPGHHAALAMHAGGQHQSPAAKEFSPKVFEAWQQAGAQFCWYGRDDDGTEGFFKTMPKDVAALPAFRWSGYVAKGEILRLPIPSIPFALDLRYKTHILVR